jgi:hypothetical protein
VGDVHYINRAGRRIKVETLDTGALPKRRRHGRFVQVPEPWLEIRLPALTLAARWLAVVLLWLSFRHHGHAFTCPNLKRYGISRFQKQRALAELERAGLIVMQRAPRRSPKIKIA